MAAVKGVKTVKRVLILIVIIIIAIVVYKLITAGPAIKPVADNVIRLRSVSDPLEKAKLVSETDSLVADMEKKEVSERWQQITNCLNQGCNDKQYFDFLIVLFTKYQSEMAKSNFLLNILAVQRYWDAADVITFSKAMSYVDEEIEAMQRNDLKKTWTRIVECNNECAENNSLFLELIRQVLA